jgi:hypothetical protein
VVPGKTATERKDAVDRRHSTWVGQWRAPVTSGMASYGMLKLSPFWDPLRADTRFEKSSLLSHQRKTNHEWDSARKSSRDVASCSFTLKHS